MVFDSNATCDRFTVKPLNLGRNSARFTVCFLGSFNFIQQNKDWKK